MREYSTSSRKKKSTNPLDSLLERSDTVADRLGLGPTKVPEKTPTPALATPLTTDKFDFPTAQGNITDPAGIRAHLDVDGDQASNELAVSFTLSTDQKQIIFSGQHRKTGDAFSHAFAHHLADPTQFAITGITTTDGVQPTHIYMRLGNPFKIESLSITPDFKGESPVYQMELPWKKDVKLLIKKEYDKKKTIVSDKNPQKTGAIWYVDLKAGRYDDKVTLWLRLPNQKKPRQAALHFRYAAGGSVLVPGPHPITLPRNFEDIHWAFNKAHSDSQGLAFDFEGGEAATPAFTVRHQISRVNQRTTPLGGDGSFNDPAKNSSNQLRLYFPPKKKTEQKKAAPKDSNQKESAQDNSDKVVTRSFEKIQGRMRGRKNGHRMLATMSTDIALHASRNLEQQSTQFDPDQAMFSLQTGIHHTIGQAYQMGVINSEVYDAWVLMNLEFGMSPYLYGEVDMGQRFPEAQLKRLVHLSKAFVQGFLQETKESAQWTGTGWENKYNDIKDSLVLPTSEEVGELKKRGYQVADSKLNQLPEAIKGHRWSQVKKLYGLAHQYYVSWVVDRMKQYQAPNEKYAATLQAQRDYLAVLAEQKNQGRELHQVKAVFYASKEYLFKSDHTGKKNNYAGQYQSLDKIAVPLQLFYFKEGDAWKLLHISGRGTFVAEEPYNEKGPTQKLFQGLKENKELLLSGHVHYQVPGGVGGTVEIVNILPAGEATKMIGTGLGIGVLVASLAFGASGPAVLLLSAISGGLVGGGAAYHAYHANKHEYATGKSNFLDGVDMVTALLPLYKLLRGKAIDDIIEGTAGKMDTKVFVFLQGVDIGANAVAGVMTTLADLNTIKGIYQDPKEKSKGLQITWRSIYLVAKDALAMAAIYVGGGDLRKINRYRRRGYVTSKELPPDAKMQQLAPAKKIPQPASKSNKKNNNEPTHLIKAEQWQAHADDWKIEHQKLKLDQNKQVAAGETHLLGPFQAQGKNQHHVFDYGEVNAKFVVMNADNPDTRYVAKVNDQYQYRSTTGNMRQLNRTKGDQKRIQEASLVYKEQAVQFNQEDGYYIHYPNKNDITRIVNIADIRVKVVQLDTRAKAIGQLVRRQGGREVYFVWVGNAQNGYAAPLKTAKTYVNLSGNNGSVGNRPIYRGHLDFMGATVKVTKGAGNKVTYKYKTTGKEGDGIWEPIAPAEWGKMKLKYQEVANRAAVDAELKSQQSGQKKTPTSKTGQKTTRAQAKEAKLVKAMMMQKGKETLQAKFIWVGRGEKRYAARLTPNANYYFNQNGGRGKVAEGKTIYQAKLTYKGGKVAIKTDPNKKVSYLHDNKAIPKGQYKDLKVEIKPVNDEK